MQEILINKDLRQDMYSR